ncbi:MAG: type II CAAX endopeptidase family protein [Gammaproteobacteria bacterium]
MNRMPGLAVRVFIAIGLVLLLFVLVYAPAFAIVASIKPPIRVVVPLIIIITSALACLYVWILGRRSGDFQEFGFRSCDSRYLVLAGSLAVPIGLLLTYIDQRFTVSNQVGATDFQPWLSVIYFVICASFQEEVIFRGLLQTTLTKRLSGSLRLPGNIVSTPAIFIAVLFGVIHLKIGIFTAFSALVLGLLAGELRQRSGSLLPAVLTHAIFNAAALVWALK